jgi:cardiolipin synthase
MNITDYHLRSLFKEQAWRDTGIMVRGPDVSVLTQSFEDVWGGRLKRFRRRLRRKEVKTSTLVRLNVSGRERRESYLDLLVRLVGAQKRIWITNAYFVPDGSLLRVLTVVARENVDVKVLVPAFSDVVFMPWVASAFHLGLLKAGVRVFEYTGSVLHAKTMLIDDWGLVGSSNLNHRSLLHDLEVDVVVPNEDARKAMEEQFINDLGSAQEITLENWSNRPFIERLIGRILLWVRYLL